MVKHKRKRRSFRPRKLIKRVIVLAVMAALLWGIFLLGRSAVWAASSFFNRPEYLAVAVSQEVTDLSGITAEAVVLKDEVVVLANKPGRANLLISEGENVSAGQRVIEVVDKSLLSNIESEISKLENRQVTGNPSSAHDLANLDDKLSQSEGKLQEIKHQFLTALRQQAVSTYKSIYASWNRQAQEVAKLQQDRLRMVQGQTVDEDRRAELENMKQQAIVPVVAPANGRVLYTVDGLEQQASLSNLSPNLWQNLHQHKIQQFKTTADAPIAAGQPIFKIATSKEIYLLVNIASGSETELANASALQVQLTSLEGSPSTAVERVVQQKLGENQMLLRLVPDELPALPRFLQVSLRPEGEVLCRIPKQAIVTIDNRPQVFVLNGNIVNSVPVEIRQEEKQGFIVAGLNPGIAVVRNPQDLTDGTDVTERIRK